VAVASSRDAVARYQSFGQKERFFGDFRDTRFVGADAHEYGRSHHEPVNSQETVE